MNKTKVTSLMTAIVTMYYIKNEEVYVKVVSKILEKYDYKEILSNFESYLINNISGFPPTPAHLLNLEAKRTKEKLEAAEIFENVINQLRKAYKLNELDLSTLSINAFKALEGSTYLRCIIKNAQNDTKEITQLSWAKKKNL